MVQGNAPAEQAQIDDPKSSVFTRYVRTVAAGNEPAREQIAEVWQALRGRLRRELGRRGLWQRPPSFLGVLGYTQWAEGGPNTGDALDELTASCFSFVLIDRIANLQAQLTHKEHIEGIAVRSVRNFVQELQERHDPMGTRAFKVLHGTVQQALKAGVLHVVAGPPRLGANTVLAFSPQVRPVADAGLVSAHVEGWNDQLMPALVTTTGRGHAKLEAEVQSLVVALRAVGIEAFRFADVLDPLRRDLRQRWTSTFQAAFDAGVNEETDERLVSLVRAVAARDRAFEHRDTFEALQRCVEERLRDVDADLATRRFLRALWRALAAWATSLDLPPGEAPPPLLEPEVVPSRREIGRRLKIPRDRLPTLYMMVGDLVEGCRASIHAPATDAGATSKEARPIGTKMDLEKRQQALVQQSLEAAAKARPSSTAASDAVSGPPGVGRVYTFAHRAAEGLEWVLLRLPDEDHHDILFVAADTDPQAGPGDVIVPATAAGGPLTLRCGYVVSLPLSVVEAAQPSRSINADRANAALRATLRNECEDGEPDEDNDPDFTAWMAEVAEAVQQLRRQRAEPEAAPASPVSDAPLPFPAPHTTEPASRRPAPWLVPIAAALALCTLGLGFWNLDLRRELTDLRRVVTGLRAPRVADEVFVAQLYDTTRGTVLDPWVIQKDWNSVEFVLTADLISAPCTAVRIDFDTSSGTTAWSTRRHLGKTEIAIPVLSSYLREEGVTAMHVYSLCAAAPNLEMTQPIELADE